MSGRPWTDSEIRYLELNWSSKDARKIAATLKRTKTAILNQGRRMGLGRQIDGNGELLNVGMINHAFGKYTVSHITADYMEKTGLNVRRLRQGRVMRYLVYISEFWEWLRINQSLFPLSRLVPLALGPEPEWVEKARRASRTHPVHNSRKTWTEHDDMLLLSMTRQERPISEICAALKRSESAVRQHATKNWAVDLSYAAEHRRRPWTEEEKRQIVELARDGYCSAEIARKIDRSERMVRVKLREVAGTSSIDQVQRAAAGEETKKRGKRKQAQRGDTGRDRGKRKAG